VTGFPEFPNTTLLPGVTRVVLVSKHISSSALPEWLSDVSSLKKLVIKHCHSIKSLPACMQQLTNLQLLVIDRDNKELKQWCESEDNKAKLAHINIVSSRLNGIYSPKSSIQLSHDLPVYFQQVKYLHLFLGTYIKALCFHSLCA
jgi:hypothetical protein